MFFLKYNKWKIVNKVNKRVVDKYIVPHYKTSTFNQVFIVTIHPNKEVLLRLIWFASRVITKQMEAYTANIQERNTPPHTIIGDHTLAIFCCTISRRLFSLSFIFLSRQFLLLWGGKKGSIIFRSFRTLFTITFSAVIAKIYTLQT